MTRNDEQRATRWIRALWTAGGALAMGAVLTIALPERASAGDDFERGFKRELGAIAAQEAVGIGRHILVGAVTGQYRHGRDHVRYDGHRHDRVKHHKRHGHRHDRVRHRGHDHYGDVYRPYRYGYRYGYRPYRGYRWHRHHHHRPRRVVERHYYHGPHCGH